MYVQPAVSTPYILPSAVYPAPVQAWPPWSHSLTVTGVKYIAKNTVKVTVASNKATAGIYYYWYAEGDFMAATRRPSFTFYVLDSGPVQVDVIDHTHPDMDTSAEAPEGFPGRRTVYWNPPQDEDVKKYRVRIRKNAGDWTTIGSIPHRDGTWNYFLVTPVLDDLADYEIDVAAVDEAGNTGSTVATASFGVVRVPDAEDYDVSYSDETNKFIFAST